MHSSCIHTAGAAAYMPASHSRLLSDEHSPHIVLLLSCTGYHDIARIPGDQKSSLDIMGNLQHGKFS